MEKLSDLDGTTFLVFQWGLVPRAHMLLNMSLAPRRTNKPGVSINIFVWDPGLESRLKRISIDSISTGAKVNFRTRFAYGTRFIFEGMSVFDFMAHGDMFSYKSLVRLAWYSDVLLSPVALQFNHPLHVTEVLSFGGMLLESLEGDGWNITTSSSDWDTATSSICGSFNLCESSKGDDFHAEDSSGDGHYSANDFSIPRISWRFISDHGCMLR